VVCLYSPSGPSWTFLGWTLQVPSVLQPVHLHFLQFRTVRRCLVTSAVSEFIQFASGSRFAVSRVKKTCSSHWWQSVSALLLRTLPTLHWRCHCPYWKIAPALGVGKSSVLT